MYWRYDIEQGGYGVVIADSIGEATTKVTKAYQNHSGDEFTETVTITQLCQPFDDAPDVIEVGDDLSFTKSEMTATLYKHGDNDYEVWFLDLPKEAREVIEAILNCYRDTGCSVRGTAEQIAEELK